MRNGFIIDYETVAALLANGDDQEQADFFNTFCKELLRCCKTYHGADLQMAYVQNKLTNEAKKLLGGFDIE